MSAQSGEDIEKKYEKLLSEKQLQKLQMDKEMDPGGQTNRLERAY